MPLSGMDVLILVEEEFEEIEVFYPRIRLGAMGARVTLAGTGQQEYIGHHGYRVEVDSNIQDLSADDFDALVIPGGYAPDRLRRYEEVLDFARSMHEAGKPVAAICHAPWVLVSAGLARGRRMTSYYAIRDDVVNAGAEYVDEQVVVDDNIITSHKPEDLEMFCMQIIRAMRPEARLTPELLATR